MLAKLASPLSRKNASIEGLLKSEAAAKGQVLGSTKDFFSVKKETGRPSRTLPNAGRPAGAEKGQLKLWRPLRLKPPKLPRISPGN